MLLESARKLVLSKGFGPTTVDEVCASAGFTKRTFFYYFSKNKEMVLSLLDEQKEMFARLKKAPFMSLEDPVDRFNGYVELIIAMYQNPILDSCIVGMLSEELADTDKRIQKKCGVIFSDWAKFVKGMLRAIDKSYPFNKTVDIDLLAEHFIAVFECAVVLGRAMGSIEPMRNSLRLYKGLVLSQIAGAEQN